MLLWRAKALHGSRHCGLPMRIMNIDCNNVGAAKHVDTDSCFNELAGLLGEDPKQEL